MQWRLKSASAMDSGCVRCMMEGWSSTEGVGQGNSTYSNWRMAYSTCSNWHMQYMYGYLREKKYCRPVHQDTPGKYGKLGYFCILDVIWVTRSILMQMYAHSRQDATLVRSSMYVSKCVRMPGVVSGCHFVFSGHSSIIMRFGARSVSEHCLICWSCLLYCLHSSILLTNNNYCRY